MIKNLNMGKVILFTIAIYIAIKALLLHFMSMMYHILGIQQRH